MSIRSQPVDPERPWAGHLGGPVDAESVQRGSRFILSELSKYGVIPKTRLASRFAQFGQKLTWEAALSELIHAGAIDLVVDTRSRRVLVIPVTGQPPDPMQAGPDPFGYRGES